MAHWIDWQRVLACLFVWLQAGLIWRCWAVVAIPAAGAVAALLGATRLLSVPLRSWRYLVVLAMLAAALALTRDIFRPPESELPGSEWGVLLAEFLMLVQVAELWRRRPAAGLPVYFVGLGLAGAWLPFYHTIRVQPAGTLINGAVLACLLSAVLFDSGFGARRSLSQRTARVRRRLTLAVLLVTTAVAALASWQLSVRVARAREEAVDMFMGRVTHRRSVLGFGTDATLHSVAIEKRSNPLSVVMRVYAKRAPGYLRGRAYHRYDGFRWRPPPRSARTALRSLSRPPAGIPPAPSGERMYELRGGEPGSSWTRVEVHNDPLRESRTCFLPMRTRVLQGVGGRVRADPFRVIRGGLETNRPYVAYLGDRPLVEPLDESQSELLLKPPVDLPQLRRLARQVCPESLTPREKMDAVADFFRNGFMYSLDGFEAPPGQDDLTYFLFHRPAAHCEFFASGAVTLLRMQGVPCRYVMGYLVVELEGEYGDYWVARNRDAHAWVEAYDEQTQQWHIVEATPGVDLPVETLGAEVEGGAGQAAAAISLLSEQRWLRRWLRAARLWVTSPACGWTLAVAAPLLMLMLAAWQVFLRRPASQEDVVRQLHRTLNRQLRRRKLIRRPAETLHQFADRIRRSAEEDDFLRQAAAWQRQYAEFRYARLPAQAVPQAVPWAKGRRR